MQKLFSAEFNYIIMTLRCPHMYMLQSTASECFHGVLRQTVWKRLHFTANYLLDRSRLF